MVKYPQPKIRRFSNILLVVLPLSIYSVKIAKYDNWYAQIEIVRKTSQNEVILLYFYGFMMLYDVDHCHLYYIVLLLFIVSVLNEYLFTRNESRIRKM